MIHPLLLSNLLVDTLHAGAEDVVRQHRLAPGNLVGLLPQDVSNPAQATRVHIRVDEAHLARHGLRLDMVAWTLRPTAPRLDLGRAPTNVIRLPAASVARQHAAVVLDPPHTPCLVDLGSSSGTYVGGQRLTPDVPHPLQEGDQVRLGELPLLYISTPRLLGALLGTAT